MKCADGCQDMGGIGPLGTPRFDPAARFAGGQEGIKQPLAGLMRQYALPKIVQPGAIKARVVQVEAERIFPVHAAPDRIGGLAVREPFDIPHHDDERHAPGGDFHRAALRGIEIGKELIVIERVELSTQVHIEIPFGKAARTAVAVVSGMGGRGSGRKLMAHLLA
jgi:hypothetical protein